LEGNTVIRKLTVGSNQKVLPTAKDINIKETTNRVEIEMSKNEHSPVGEKVQVTRNGPYIVSGRIPIMKQTIICRPDGTSVEWRPGKTYPVQEKYALCRCGKSKNKPFCDGTHAKVNFDGTETAGKESYLSRPKKLIGPTLKLTDIEELCASARFCHRADGIWKLVPKSSEPESKQIAIEEACDCPSGRLVVLDKTAKRVVEPNLKKSIGLIEDPWIGIAGPIWVRGCIPVESAEGRTYQKRNRVTLCRCGRSSNKPFCDSTHYPEAETVEKVHDE
jgi:CDGSH-type Zn-finger protein